MTLRHSEGHWRLLAMVLDVHIGTAFQQTQRHLTMPVQGRQMQGCKAVVFFHIHQAGLTRDEQTCRERVALQSGVVQVIEAGLVLEAHVQM